jgi:hypothetical protein
MTKLEELKAALDAAGLAYDAAYYDYDAAYYAYHEELEKQDDKT